MRDQGTVRRGGNSRTDLHSALWSPSAKLAKPHITVTRPMSHIFHFVLDFAGTRLAGSDPLPSFSIGHRLNDRVRICTIFLTSQGLAKEHMAYGIHSPQSWSGGHSNTLHECLHLLRRNASKHLGSAEPMPPVPHVRIDDNHSRRTTTTRASVGLIVRVAAG